MARQVKAFACEYGCARRLLGSKKRMEAHEAKCFFNPQTQSCATCSHYESYLDSNGMESEPSFLQRWIHKECKADENIDLSEKLKTNCTLWKIK